MNKIRKEIWKDRLVIVGKGLSIIGYSVLAIVGLLLTGVQFLPPVLIMKVLNNEDPLDIEFFLEDFFEGAVDSFYDIRDLLSDIRECKQELREKKKEKRKRKEEMQTETKIIESEPITHKEPAIQEEKTIPNKEQQKVKKLVLKK